MLTVAGTAAVSATTPLWEPDPNALGTLTFYNALGAPVTGGTLSDQPPAYYVAASGPGRPGDSIAQLYLATPREGVNPQQWSKDVMSAATDYPNPTAPAPVNGLAAPVASTTKTDPTIALYIAEFPNLIAKDGYANLYEFRLYTSSPSKLAGVTYYRMVIQVDVLGKDKDGLVTGTWTVVYPEAKTATATTLTASPAAPAAHGTAVTLTATVTPAAAGNVHFFDGTADLGAGTYDAGTGKATLTTSPVDGAHSFTARFTPDDPKLAGSASAVLSYQVGAATGTPTNTTVTASPDGPAAHGAAVTLTATVTPALAGAVEFFDGTANLGTAAADPGTGKATVTVHPADGTHAFTAQFAPDDHAYAGSTSAALSYTVEPVAAATTAGATTGPATTPAAAAQRNPAAVPAAGQQPVAASASASTSTRPSVSPSPPSPGPTPTGPVGGALALASSTTNVALLAGMSTILVAVVATVLALLRRRRDPR
ncbi:MAG: hypothetical protein AUI14_08700 [Actinobacteria bacterium 13_2_20CM_2_71_6]|nr:MAG: hypothetical protein AUI14_08700 [Actinobacteria bacterium 13_2_20CM_2_71_6]